MLFTLKLRAIKLTFFDMAWGTMNTTLIGVLVAAADWQRKDWDRILRISSPPGLESLVIAKRNNKKECVKLRRITSYFPPTPLYFHGEIAYDVRLFCAKAKFVEATQAQWMVAPEEFPRLRMWVSDEQPDGRPDGQLAEDN